MVEGILLSHYDRRGKLSQTIETTIRQSFGSTVKVFDTHIPTDKKFVWANAAGQSIHTYDRGCAGAKAYMAFARELAGDTPAVTGDDTEQGEVSRSEEPE